MKIKLIDNDGYCRFFFVPEGERAAFWEAGNVIYRETPYSFSSTLTRQAQGQWFVFQQVGPDAVMKQGWLQSEGQY